jgi:NAD(P)-dependent dehydrogenase (short-subunit alcohol dehydrogenase family)
MSPSSGPTARLDTVLDRTIAGGYSRLGYLWRRRWSAAWPDDPAPGALSGTVVAITGGNSGLGFATALGAARLGAEVRLLCRNEEKGRTAAAEITTAVPDGVVRVDRCDVSDLEGVRRFAERFSAEVPALHALVHNAGVMVPQRQETAEGHEVNLATHVLGPHLLTDLLAPSLEAEGDGRVVFVSSGGMYTQPLRSDDPEYTRSDDYSGAKAYSRTKRMQVALAELWADRLRGRGIAVDSMHPGWADTPGVRESLPRFRALTKPLLRTPQEGADTTVWLLARNVEDTGLLWHDRRPRPTSYTSSTRPTDEQKRLLWDFCVAATGVPQE